MRLHGQGSKYRKFTVEYKGMIQIVKFWFLREKRSVRNVRIDAKFKKHLIFLLCAS